MGYSYGRNAHGNWALSCDNCGNVGGVRKRTCPYTVRTDSLRGPRSELHYCYPPALCAACYATLGGLRGVHGANCEDGARKSQAQYDETQRRIEAGEAFVVAAWGDWQAHVPAGLVGVKFTGRAGDEWRLLPAADYHPGQRPALTDYPQAQPWPVHA